MCAQSTADASPVYKPTPTTRATIGLTAPFSRMQRSATLLAAGVAIGVFLERSASRDHYIAQAQVGDDARRLEEECKQGSSALGSALGLSAALERRVVRDLKMFAPVSLPAVRMHHSSRSPLQDLFVMLHNMMHKRGLLPLSFWGLGRGPGRKASHDTDVVQREGMTRFFDEHAGLVREGATCLEWGRRFMARQPRCSTSATWDLRFRRGSASIDRQKRRLVADLTRLTSGDTVAWPQFDLIICNQVFEHVDDPFAAARSVALLLAPNGLLFFSAPFLEPFHRMPGDFFRFTPDGAATIFTRAGLQIVERRKVGDALLTTGHLLGFGTADFEPAYIERELVRPFTDGIQNRLREWMFLESALIARKPNASAAR